MSKNNASKDVWNMPVWEWFKSIPSRLKWLKDVKLETRIGYILIIMSFVLCYKIIYPHENNRDNFMNVLWAYIVILLILRWIDYILSKILKDKYIKFTQVITKTRLRRVIQLLISTIIIVLLVVFSFPFINSIL